MNNKGFILLDALISVFIVCAISTITINLFVNYKNYKDGYLYYLDDVNDLYEDIFEDLGECERCILQEEETEDSSPYEQY